MRFMGVFALIFVVLEILSVFLAARLLGGAIVIVLMIISFLLGRRLVRGRGGAAKTLLAAAMMRGNGRISPYQLLWAVRIPFAGFLLMLPGFLSDILALLLLLPLRGGDGTAAPHNGTQQQDFYGTFGGTFHSDPRNRRPDHDDDVIEGDFTTVRRGGDRDTHR
nr:FxsA family protein [Conchiformibius kuhniae]